MKSEEQRRKKIVADEVSKFTNKQTTQNKKLQEIYDKSLRDQAEAYRRQKIEDDKRIVQEAELETRKTLQNYKEELDRLHAINQKRQKDLISIVISKYQSKFRSGYEKVTVLLKSTDKENLKNMQKHNEVLKSTIAMFDELIAKVKSNEIGPKELQTAEMLVRNINELEQSIAREIEMFANEKIAKAKEERSKVEEPPPPAPTPVIEQQVVEQQVQAPQQQPPPPPPPKEETDSTPKEVQIVKPVQDMTYHQFVHPDRLLFYNKIMEFYTQKVESVKPLQVRDFFLN